MEQLIYSSKFYEILGDEVNQTLRCGVCLEYYRNPVILPCGHTFCYDCILEMAKFKKMNRMTVDLRNLRMNCPNCRFPILVHSVLQRNVTFNYPLASFLESLKQVQVPTKVDASTNTDEDENAYEYDVKKLDEIREDLDNLFSAFRLNNNVIDDARRDVEKIRQSFNMKEQESKASKITQVGKNNYKYISQNIIGQRTEQHEDQTFSILSFFNQEAKKVAPPPGFQPMPASGSALAPDHVVYQDPAIMSFGVQSPAAFINNRPLTYGQELGELVKMIQQCQK